MRLSYTIKFDDFRTLQAPFPTAAGSNAGFKGVLAACALLAALGVFCMVQGLGLPVGGFLIGLGVAAGAGAYFYEQRSVQSRKEKYEKRLAEAFQRIHCRDQRVFEADDTGYTTSCKCGTVSRPWSELVSFSENKTHFAFNSKMGGEILPKSAFPSEAQITEFRALATGKLNQDKSVTAPHFDFALRKADFREAYWMHILQGGGWRALAKVLLVYAGLIYGVFVLWNSIAANNPAVRAGLIGALVVIPAMRLMRNQRKHYLGVLRVYFSEQGLHLQDPANQSRVPWDRFVGYLEGNGVILLYSNPKQYRIIPKRALTGQAGKFQAMVESKLGAYDYRNPTRSLEVQAAS
jgi:YcxB-like protein